MFWPFVHWNIGLFDAIEDKLVTYFHLHPLIGPMTLLFAEEGGFPLPLPGDLYIAYVGYQIHRGIIPYHVAFIVLMIGILCGSTILYFLSYYFGKNLVLRFGKYIHLNEKKLIYLEKKFRKYGALVIIFGRHVPGFRIPITIFAGLSKVKYSTFILSEAVSIIAWIAIFLQIGVKLGKNTNVLFHNHFSFLLIILIPLTLTIITVMFGKFIPEANE